MQKTNLKPHLMLVFSAVIKNTNPNGVIFGTDKKLMT
jgi:hypothetical protein